MEEKDTRATSAASTFRSASGGTMQDHLISYVPSTTQVKELLPPKAPSSWAIDKLRRLGYYHPLDPFHLSFPKNQLNHVLGRLTDCFRAMSCRVSYEADLLSAACLTMEQVEFQVSMFIDRTDAENILLEVQRRAGDSYTFHHDYAQAIRKAVQGQPVEEKTMDMDIDLGLSLEKLSQSMATDDDITVAIELATALVLADRLDECRLGMESLEALTDISKTGQSTARKVSRALVMPQDEISRKLSEAMKEFLLEKSEENLSYHALMVWSNAWQVAADDIETPVESFCPMVCEEYELMHCLMSRVEEVHRQPHEATLALKGLTALCREMPQLRTSVSWKAVEKCQLVGSAQNYALEQASRRFLETSR